MEFWNGNGSRLGERLGAVTDWVRLQVSEVSSIRFLTCLKTAFTVVTVGAIMQVEASTSYVHSAAAINANDSISWSRVGASGDVIFNPVGGVSTNGMPFTASKPPAGSMRVESLSLSGGEVCLDTLNSSKVTIEFAQPVEAAGAPVYVSSPIIGNVTLRAYDASGMPVSQTTELLAPGQVDASKYLGATTDGGNIKTLEFSTDFGVLSLGHVDLRTMVDDKDTILNDGQGNILKSSTHAPAPSVANQVFNVFKNSGFLTPNPNVLGGSYNTEGARLVKGPLHAQTFALYPDGSFVYEPAADYFGPDNFTFVGVGNYGMSQSMPAKADINVIWVNSAPRFQAGPNEVSQQDCGDQTVLKWATKISAGAADEDRTQTIRWLIYNDNPDLFTVQPRLSLDGTLTYTPEPGAIGFAKLTIWLKDDGGTVNGGVDTSEPAHMTLAVEPVNHKPSLNPLGDRVVAPGATLEAHAAASSVDLGRFVTYQMSGAPQGMTINPLNGRIEWTPSEEAAGRSYAVTVKAISGGDPDSSDEQVMIVNVVPSLQVRRETLQSQRGLVATKSSKRTPTGRHTWGFAAMHIAGFTAQRSRPGAPRHRKFWVE